MVTGTELTHVVYAAPPASRHGRKSQVAGPDGPAGASLLVRAGRRGGWARQPCSIAVTACLPGGTKISRYIIQVNHSRLITLRELYRVS